MAIASRTCSWSSATRMVESSGEGLMRVRLTMLQTEGHLATVAISLQMLVTLCVCRLRLAHNRKCLSANGHTKQRAQKFPNVALAAVCGDWPHSQDDPWISQLWCTRVEFNFVHEPRVPAKALAQQQVETALTLQVRPDIICAHLKGRFSKKRQSL